jgi:hypothetical protein
MKHGKIIDPPCEVSGGMYDFGHSLDVTIEFGPDGHLIFNIEGEPDVIDEFEQMYAAWRASNLDQARRNDGSFIKPSPAIKIETTADAAAE